MPKVTYVPKKFTKEHDAVIEHANTIIGEYQAQGYELTLRQLYYQFVSRALIANKQAEYKRLGGIINEARLAGRIDWLAIVDRTRGLKGLAHWDSPSDIIDASAYSYRTDKWDTQPYRVEVWIEKDALAGVFDRIARELDVPVFSCRGYTSQSEMWVASQRIRGYAQETNGHSGKKEVVILHFGDHDPSGLDMTRDITDRLSLFGARLDVRRLALNMNQVEQYDPPPNPAKETDSRFEGYIKTYGDESWELDALEPDVLAGLVRREIISLRESKAWAAAEVEEQKQKGLLKAVSEQWEAVAEFVGENDE